eukprot:gb/GECH01009493.1/.p1 GENE.gb/GECH01009493.1/~~gb/GECH01009493.1/.p1  ORF type:complete len:196 (+),score=45.07 gb/GECH01009493.1/:1-588(+)
MSMNHEVLPQRRVRSRRKQRKIEEKEEQTRKDTNDNNSIKNDTQSISECPKNQPHNYEFLDHTADVQFHTWGKTIQEAFEQQALAMFAFMTEDSLDTVSVDRVVEIEASGHDMETLLYSFMHEFLFMFGTEYVVCKAIVIDEFDRERWKIKARGFGEVFTIGKHPQGTEIKAITYSNMQIWEKEDQSDLYVIVDI